MNASAPYARRGGWPAAQEVLLVVADLVAALGADEHRASLMALSAGGSTDPALGDAAERLGLGLSDVVAVALADAVEASASAAAAVRRLQGGAEPFPTEPLVRRIVTALGETVGPHDSIAQRARDVGLLASVSEDTPFSETGLRLCAPVRLARGLASPLRNGPTPLSADNAPGPWFGAAAALALSLGDEPAALVLEDGEWGDRLSFAVALARCFGLTPMVMPAAAISGLGAAVLVGRWLPVETIGMAAGRVETALDLAPYDGPRVLMTDRCGAVAVAGRALPVRLPALSTADRHALWRDALPDIALPQRIGAYKIGPSRIADIAVRTRQTSSDTDAALRRAMGEAMVPSLEPHAVHVPGDVPDAAFAADAALSADLALLLARCRRHLQRTGAPAGPQMPGVRALLSGPSGTGKTFACAWLATRLCLPLFKVDLSSVVSKYIGETEENLQKMLERAEATACLLLIDEADSLFGSRVEAHNGTDRFANNQTNFLLSRIETFDGLVILTTNGRERIDPAFSRRLDQIVEMPMPAPKERRRILELHLPDQHALDRGELNKLASHVDLAGGHLRQIVETAMVLAECEGVPVAFHHTVAGTRQEYRKLGRPPPHALEAA